MDVTPILESLNDAQRQAVTAPAEPTLVIAGAGTGRDEYDGRFTRWAGALIARCPTVRELVMHPTVVGTVGAFLDHVTSFQLHLTQIISIEPGETQQKLHRDQMAFDFFPFPPDYHVQCNTIWALTDFTEANGATRLMPGSQELPDDHGHTLDETVPAEMSIGSCLLYTCKVYHGGGANTSEETRMGLNITYDVGWLRQEENQYLSVPREVAQGLDDDLLRLIGYRTGAYALGYVDDVRVVATGLALLVLGRPFLGYPPAWAGALILVIESAAMLSIATALALAFIGGRPQAPGQATGATESLLAAAATTAARSEHGSGTTTPGAGKEEQSRC